MTKHSLIIDEELCWGCKTCEVACSQEYDHQIKYVHVIQDGPNRVGDRFEYVHHPTVCRHCDDPPCADACPEEAIKKRDDGVVILDYDLCSGCRMCIEECPYDAIGFDDKEQKALKCNMCSHRVDKGLIPACADNVCPSHCIYFGDSEEIEESIEIKRRRRRTV